MKQADCDAIANTLTQRYNSTRRLATPLVLIDFKPFKAAHAGAESYALDIIRYDLARRRSKSAAVLSSGANPVLTLAMPKKFRPDFKVSCVGMGFGDADDETEYARRIGKAKYRIRLSCSGWCRYFQGLRWRQPSRSA